MDKKILFSGIQPSGSLTLGNYLGALKNFVKLQDEYNCLFSVVDLHAITVRQVPKDLRQRSLELLSIFIASGIDPEKSILFLQSHVPAHAELSWVLNCNTMFGELSRMTQFKDKSKKHSDNINSGLFTYPVLMAADILLYQTNVVPVGQDQKQHLEISRDIANRFNSAYSETFKVPEPYIPKKAAKIMSLSDPTRKMSKSDENPNGYILIMDKPEDIMRKFKKAVTDSDGKVEYKKGKDGINNLMDIYSTITGKSYEEIENEFSDKGYGEFKTAVGEAVVNELTPIREKTLELLQNKDYLEKVYLDGAMKARKLSGRTLEKVYRKVGFVKREF